MSETTAPAPVAGSTVVASITTIEDSIIALEPMLIMLFASKLGGPINTTIQGSIKIVDTDAVNLLNEAKAALDKAEASNPAVTKFLQIVTTGLAAMNVALPSEAQVFSHLQAALADLQGALVPAVPVA